MTNPFRAVACIRFVRRVGLLALLLIAGPPYLIVLLFVSPAALCVDDSTDPIHRLIDPLFWWWDSWKACRATPNDPSAGTAE
jgi:hypothetical protein